MPGAYATIFFCSPKAGNSGSSFIGLSMISYRNTLTSFQLAASFWKFLKFPHTRKLSPQIWIQHPKLCIISNFHVPRVCDFDFMTIMNLKAISDLTVKIIPGVGV